MYIEREIWKGGKVVGEKSLKIILNRSISSFLLFLYKKVIVKNAYSYVQKE